MKTVCTCCAVLLAALPLLAQATLVEERGADTRTFVGSVEDQHGNPLPGVIVEFNHTIYPQQVQTNGNGQYMLTIGPGIDLGATYPYSFRKPGYAPLDESRLLNDPKRVIMKPAPCGYLFIKNADTGNPIADMDAAANDPSIQCGYSNRYGFLIVTLPGKFDPDREIRIVIPGNIQYEKQEIRTTARSLTAQVVDVHLKPSNKTYTQILNTILESHRKLADPNLGIEAEAEFLDNIQYLDKQRLSKKDQADWNKRRLELRPAYDYILKNHQALKLIKLREIKVVELEEASKKVAKIPGLEQRLHGIEDLIKRYFEIIELDYGIFQNNNDPYFLDEDCAGLKALLDQEDQLLNNPKLPLPEQTKNTWLARLAEHYESYKRKLRRT